MLPRKAHYSTVYDFDTTSAGSRPSMLSPGKDALGYAIDEHHRPE